MVRRANQWRPRRDQLAREVLGIWFGVGGHRGTLGKGVMSAC